MPIVINYDTTIDTIVIKATGRIIYKDILILANGLIAHSNFRMNINQLFDSTEGELDLSTEEVKQISQDFLQISEVLGLKRRLAIAVSRDLDFGMMRMYAVFFEAGPGVEVNIFKSLDEARKWLKVS